mgnify:CR=1 FL=1
MSLARMVAVSVFIASIPSVTAWAAITGDGHDHAAEAASRSGGAAHDDALDVGMQETRDDHDDPGPGHDAEASGGGLGDERGGAHRDERAEEGGVALNEAAQKAADIRVEAVMPQAVAPTVNAPGEVRVDAYRTSKVTPRLAVQIVERFAKLGDRVGAGQRLASLSSVEMAEAQGQMLVAASEWSRVQKLGEQTVSEKRYSEAKIAYQQARAKLLSFGLPSTQLKALIETGDSALAAGTFDLLAPRAGTVISDDFVEGEFVEPGRLLFEVADESQVWVESRVAPVDGAAIAVGAKASIVTKDGARYEGSVTHVRRQVEESTRTVGVRIAVNNNDGKLRPGLFVQTRLAGSGTAKAFVLPQQAVIRTPDGDWGVYLETAPGRFKMTEVQVEREIDGNVYVNGLTPGSRVVTQGAFFVQSEQAKSGFDPHNH